MFIVFVSADATLLTHFRKKMSMSHTSGVTTRAPRTTAVRWDTGGSIYYGGPFMNVFWVIVLSYFCVTALVPSIVSASWDQRIRNYTLHETNSAKPHDTRVTWRELERQLCVEIQPLGLLQHHWIRLASVSVSSRLLRPPTNKPYKPKNHNVFIFSTSYFGIRMSKKTLKFVLQLLVVNICQQHFWCTRTMRRRNGCWQVGRIEGMLKLEMRAS